MKVLKKHISWKDQVLMKSKMKVIYMTKVEISDARVSTGVFVKEEDGSVSVDLTDGLRQEISFKQRRYNHIYYRICICGI